MKFGICQELFGETPWDAQCALIAGLGYDGVEIAPFTLAPLVTDVTAARRAELRRVAEDAGLEVIGLHWLLAKTTGLHLTTADAAVRRRTGHYLAALADACADLGGSVLVLGSPQQRGLEPGVNIERAFDHAAEVLGLALPTCAARGVTLALEPLTPKETDFLNTCEQAVELMSRVNHPNLALHQDVKAMLGGESESIPALVEKYAAQTVHFHANDSNLLGPGMGDTDFVPIFEALLKRDYAGYVSVEVFDYAPGPETIARASLATMQTALAAAQKSAHRTPRG